MSRTPARMPIHQEWAHGEDGGSQMFENRVGDVEQDDDHQNSVDGGHQLIEGTLPQWLKKSMMVRTSTMPANQQTDWRRSRIQWRRWTTARWRPLATPAFLFSLGASTITANDSGRGRPGGSPSTF